MRNKIKLAISCEPMLGEFVFGKSLCRLFTEHQCESHWNGQFDSSREIQKGDFHDFLLCSTLFQHAETGRCQDEGLNGRARQVEQDDSIFVARFRQTQQSSPRNWLKAPFCAKQCGNHNCKTPRNPPVVWKICLGLSSCLSYRPVLLEHAAITKVEGGIAIDRPTHFLTLHV